MSDAMRCGLCGQRVSVASGSEGTNHYVGEDEAEVERLRQALTTIAHWRGSLTAADAGTMRATARAALDAEAGKRA